MERSRKTIVLTLLATFIMMALLVVFTTRTIYRMSYSYIHELGEDKTSAITADLENYLENARSVLWIAADTVDHMVLNGATSEEIVEYITRESTNTERQFDESYTGLYGVVGGVYVDGVGWTPPEGYDPTVRDWYLTTVAADGEAIIVSPYVDAQTGNVIISICKALTDRHDVLSLDLTLSGVQELVEEIKMNDSGYGFVINRDGMIISHPDTNKNGDYLYSTKEGKELYDKVLSVGKGNFDIQLGGEKCTVFVDTVMDQWHLIIVTKSNELLYAPMSLMALSIIITLIVFGLISMFYIVGYRHERRINKRMEKMIEDEQKKDYEAKLLKLEKSAADSANKAKSDFLADMSHEIRTPINAVLGMNEMILHESDDDKIIDYASNIKSAGNTLLSIINNILDFSKIEDGKMNLVPVEFDTAELINGLVNSISERAKSKDLDLVVDVDERMPSRLFGDDVRISQVIMNLLTNAVKYTQKGSVTFRAAVKEISDGDAMLRFDVIDTGIGIKKEDFDKLSKSFERIEERRNRNIEGTGLGISIVTRLLSMMGSRLNVESEYGKGSTFGFDLKLRIVDPTPVGRFEEKRGNVPRSADSGPHIKAPRAKVLITDDNKMNLKVASNIMKFFDITPVVCRSGAETIRLFREQRFDIIFLDHMMPNMDGIETLKVLKDEDLLDGTAAIALTANAVVGAKEQYLAAGFDDYLSKPIILPDLEKMLKTYLPASVVEEGSSVERNASSGLEPAPASGTEKETDTINETDTAGMPLSVEKARLLGLNVSDGISYSGGDEDFYLEILDEYAKASDGKCDSLDGFFNEKDWKSYTILVHSIKSTSKTIGAEDISEQARLLEEAAKSGDAGYIEENHGRLIASYKEMSRRIES